MDQKLKNAIDDYQKFWKSFKSVKDLSYVDRELIKQTLNLNKTFYKLLSDTRVYCKNYLKYVESLKDQEIVVADKNLLQEGDYLSNEWMQLGNIAEEVRVEWRDPKKSPIEPSNTGNKILLVINGLGVVGFTVAAFLSSHWFLIGTTVSAAAFGVTYHYRKSNCDVVKGMDNLSTIARNFQSDMQSIYLQTPTLEEARKLAKKFDELLANAQKASYDE